MKMELKLKNTNIGYPNLSTVLMVEDILKENSALPLKISEVKKLLPKKVMPQTLKIILEYLWISGKIIYGPKGIQWVFTKQKKMNKLIEKSLEL